MTKKSNPRKRICDRCGRLMPIGRSDCECQHTVLVETKTPVIGWYARGGGVARCGPFKTQVEATQAIRQGRFGRDFPDDAFVWPEELPF